MSTWRVEVDADGVALLTIDMPGRTMNVFDEASSRDLAEAIDRVLADPAVRGGVFASAKPAFIAGADLDMLGRMFAEVAHLPETARAKAIFARVSVMQGVFRRIETGGKPFAAAIGGTAMGGGFELCLAAHRRFVADDPRIQLGLPESKVGLLPGAGGTQRLPRMIGADRALPLLLEGKALSPSAALKARIVDEVVPATELIARATAWVRDAKPEDAVKPWDRKGFVYPGPDPRTHGGGGMFAVGNAMQRKTTYGNYPALDAILGAVYDAWVTPIDVAFRIESKYFTKLLIGANARNMIRTHFVNLQRANKLESRPKGIAAHSFRRVGVLGAGLMGAGIAHVAAKAGIEVVLIDRDQDAAERGRAHAAKWLDGDIAKGRTTREKADALLARIHPGTDYAALSDADMVIEAVFEERGVKADVTRRAFAAMRPDAVFATNTSTLPITSLAEAAADAQRFVGLHFFSPVERMPLIEIIRGERTGEATLAAALDFTRAIGKTPIVVRDSRGFYTSRVFGTYTREGMCMLTEGVAPALIENAGRMTGMPMPPLALTDEVALDLVHRIATQTRKDLGDAYEPSPVDDLIARMVEKLGRPGKKGGKGFYEYPSDGPKRLWPGLTEVFPPADAQPGVEDLKTRLLAAQALEAARCFEEGVVARPEDADVGATLGWGFAPWTGGPLSFIDTMGAAAFVTLCDRLAQAHGARFAPTARLRQMAATGGQFYPEALAAAA